MKVEVSRHNDDDLEGINQTEKDESDEIKNLQFNQPQISQVAASVDFHWIGRCCRVGLFNLPTGQPGRGFAILHANRFRRDFPLRF